MYESHVVTPTANATGGDADVVRGDYNMDCIVPFRVEIKTSEGSRGLYTGRQ